MSNKLIKDITTIAIVLFLVIISYFIVLDSSVEAMDPGGERTYDVKLADPKENDPFGGDFTTTPMNQKCCFPAGTMIRMADNSSRKIENIKTGDFVLSFDINNKEYVKTMVTKLIIKIREGVYNINNDYIRPTNDHPIYTQKTNGNTCWASIKPEMTKQSYPSLAGSIMQLEQGDKMLTLEDTWVKISSIEYQPGIIQTYTFNVENKDADADNYFANGILVHNYGCDDNPIEGSEEGIEGSHFGNNDEKGNNNDEQEDEEGSSDGDSDAIYNDNKGDSIVEDNVDENSEIEDVEIVNDEDIFDDELEEGIIDDNIAKNDINDILNNILNLEDNTPKNNDDKKGNRKKGGFYLIGNNLFDDVLSSNLLLILIIISIAGLTLLAYVIYKDKFIYTSKKNNKQEKPEIIKKPTINEIATYLQVNK